MSQETSERPRGRIGIGGWLAICAVTVVYVFFGSTGSFEFRRQRWQTTDLGRGYYAGQAEGFRRGQVNLAHTPDPRLATLENPYDPNQRGAAQIEYLWDASYYKGKYYLYFSPVPTLIFYLPYGVLGSGYPSDALAATVFAVWAFIASVLFVRRALAGRRPFVPLWLWVLFLGVGNLVPFTLVYIRIYEVAILAAMAFSATWACALINFSEKQTFRSAIWMGLWLALAIATRPNLGVLLLPAAIAIWAVGREKLIRLALGVLIPLGVAFLLLVAHNVARYGQPLEFGHRYQLTAMNMEGRAVCRLCNLKEGLRFVNSLLHYLTWPPGVWTEFPYAHLQAAHLDPRVSFEIGTEETAGIIPIIPLTVFGSVIALVLASSRGPRDLAASAAVSVTGGAWLIMAGLSMCWWVVARYTHDFMLLMTMGTVVAIEVAFGWLRMNGFRALWLRVAVVVLAVYSILLGLFLGLQGPGGGFKKLNYEAFSSVAKALGARAPQPPF